MPGSRTRRATGRTAPPTPTRRGPRAPLDHAKRETCRLGCVSEDEAGAWYAVDLGTGRRLALTHYALQHGGHRAGRRLRNWVLEASNAPHALDGAAAL